MRVNEATRMFVRAVPLLLAFLALLTLAGCASGSLSNVFSSDSKKGALAPISFAPIIGAPANVSGELTKQLIREAQQKNIPVVTEQGSTAEYTVRGYLAASQDRSSNKLAYIWDVTNASGKRVHRVLGEETTKAQSGRDAWATFDSAALQKIAAKTATDLAAWLPKQSSPTSPQPVVASQPQASSPPKKKPSPPRVASIKKGPVQTYVPSVTGAPGDGRKSLTKAIKTTLSGKGVKLASASGSNVYTVRGSVKMGQPSGGQQDINIAWEVLAPDGQLLGTVSQANKIPQGSLDKKWGPIAANAASAAADGIVKLIPKR